MPRGGKRNGAGRRPSTEPKEQLVAAREARAELKAYASQFTTEAIDSLVAIGRGSKTPHAAKVAAWREVLDRGHGRPPQAITGEGGGPIRIATIVDELHP